MRPNTILAPTILALVAFGRAEPVAVERRYDVGNAINSYTALAGSYYSEGTAAAASWYSDGISAASVGVQEGLSDASTWLQSHAAGTTSVGGAVATVTSNGGVIVTSIGGPAVTLASSGVIASPTSTANAAVNVHPMTLKASPVLTALVTVVAGTLLGAWLTC